MMARKGGASREAPFFCGKPLGGVAGWIFITLVVAFCAGQAEAGIAVTDTKSGVRIKVEHESLESVLRYYHRRYHADAVFPRANAGDIIQATARGKNLVQATARLFRGYNLVLEEGPRHSIRRITLLPTYSRRGQAGDSGVQVIGDGSPASMAAYQRLRLWRRRASHPPRGARAPRRAFRGWGLRSRSATSGMTPPPSASSGKGQSAAWAGRISPSLTPPGGGENNSSQR